MNILHVIPYMHPNGGGPPVVVDRFSRELIAQGHQVNVFTTDALVPAGDNQWEQAEDRPYRMLTMPALRRTAFAYNRKLTTELHDMVAATDLVHLHNLWSYMTLAVDAVCRSLKKPFVVSPHGMLDPHSLARKALKKQIYGRLLEYPRLCRATGMIYTHPKEQQLAEQSCPGLPTGFVVPLGADEPPQTGMEETRRELLQQYPEWENRQLVLFFGRLHPKKGVELLIPALKHLSLKTSHVHLILAGPVEPDYLQQLQQLIQQHRVGSQVTFTGPVYGLTKWTLLSLADLFVLPSYQENFAITVVEALRMGTPVVLSDRVNIWEEIIAARAGLLCQLDPISIADQIATLLTKPELRQEFSLHGPELVLQHFNWPDAGQKLNDVYQTICSHGKI